jgi:multidrug resistance protein, MATE family
MSRTGHGLRIPTRREIRDVARLAAPIVLVQVGLMMMGVVDTAMVGRVSEGALAAVALGNLYWILVTMLGQGTIMALDPIISQAVGARDEPAIERGLQRGLLMALLISVVSSLALLPGDAFFTLLRQPPEIYPLAGQYARVCIFGVLPFFGFVVLRQTLQAFSLVRPIVYAVVLSNLANLLLDWMFVFGRLGAPAMGAVGTAWASSICRWLMWLLLAWGGRAALAPYLRHWHRDVFAWGPIWSLLRLGLPIGLHQWIEVAAFSFGLVLVGWMGTLPLAAHQITITLAALTYMVPLGVSAAVAVLVGHAIGRGDPDGARREAGAALVCGVGFMTLTAISLIAAPATLARLFSPDVAVVALAATLIPLAGVFQIFDGIQGVSSGILRGTGDTHVPAMLNLAGYTFGLAVGGVLAFRLAMGPRGVWWGLVAGLVMVAIALGARVRHRLGGELRRIEHGAPAPTAG